MDTKFVILGKAGNETTTEDLPGLDDSKRLLTINGLPLSYEFIDSILKAVKVWLL